MGEVYRARDAKLQRDVAIKVLPSDFLPRPDAKARFEREARAVATLSHPNILAIHDFGESDGVVYAVMELLDGETLREALAHGPLSPRQAVAYATQLAQGLAAAHDRGIIHRDLKPENVFITPDGRVKILDFGLARQTEPAAGTAQTVAETMHSPTEPGIILGTVGYMSPEQVRGAAVDARSDLFSFGAVLYEMVTGERAFHRPTAAETMTAILREDPSDPPADRPLAPPIDRIIRHCLEKKPEARFRSAHDLAFALDAIGTPSSASVSGLKSAATETVARSPRSAKTLAVAAAVVVLAVGAGVLIGRATLRTNASTAIPKPPSFRQLTFRRGVVPMSRFTPDGQTVVYSAMWDDSSERLFLTRLESPGATPLAVPNAELFSVSPSAELALGLDPPIDRVLQPLTLAQAPLLGGAPRSVLEDVTFADWSPTGSGLALVRVVGSRQRLEFPAGKVLYETEGAIGFPRVSPSGDRIAFLDWPVKQDDRGTVVIVNLNGAKQTISKTWEAVSGLAWTPDGREVWYTAAEAGTRYSLMASANGRERQIYAAPVGVRLYDIAKDGRVLLASSEFSFQVNVSLNGEGERDLSWLGWSDVRDISPDGRSLLLSYSGEGSSTNYDVYVRATDGKDPTHIGEGQAQQFSPDGRSVLSVVHGPPARLTILPTGPGEARTVPTGNVTVTSARWLPDGRQLLIVGTEPGKRLRAYVTDVNGATPRPISPEGISFTLDILPLSPDGSRAAFRSPEGPVLVYPLAGGEPAPVNGLNADDMPIGWTGDGRGLLLLDGRPPRRILKLDPASGRRELLKEIHPSDPGSVGPTKVIITPDGRSYAADYPRAQMTLYLVEGLK
jgi:serine/threonine protein kinase/Tol biopolymer transport system component